MLQNIKILFQKFTPKNLNTPYAHGPQGLWSCRTVEPAARRRGRKAAASRRRTACRGLLPLSSVSMSIPPFRFYPGRRELCRNRAGAGRNKKRPHRLGLSRRSRRRCSMVHEEKVGRRPYGQLARRGPFHCGSADRAREPVAHTYAMRGNVRTLSFRGAGARARTTASSRSRSRARRTSRARPPVVSI